MTAAKKVFLSYSTVDRAFAERFARALVGHGVDVWYDKWEIGPGDSLVERIFEEGLRDAEAFVVILSGASVRSAWVREELSIAVIQRISKLTRIIPVLWEDVEIPTSLRALRWVDMRTHFDEGIREIVNVLHGATEKPPVGALPAHLSTLPESVAGLSRLATSVGRSLLDSTPVDEAFGRAVLNTTLAESLHLTPTELNDAVDELETQGLAKTNNELNTHPYAFRFVEPTYLLYHAFEDGLSYRPLEDVRVAIAAIAALSTATGSALAEQTGLSVGRLNRAVDYIRDHGYADVIQALGSAPYSFYRAESSRVTRQLAERQ